MFAELFSYDPAEIDPKYREQMVAILRAKSELLRVTAEVNDLRARTWGGDDSVVGLMELKAADLAALRQDFIALVGPFLEQVVDVEGLKSLLPMIAMAAMQNLKVPFPVIFEACGVDFDQFKLLADQIKEFVSEL